MTGLPNDAPPVRTRIERLLYDRIGLDPSTVGSSLVERAVHRRMRICKLDHVDDYDARVSVDEEELLELVEEVVIPETYFFREPEALDAVAQRVVQRGIGAAADAPFRILSAPCSTGEEPYSIAMTLLAAGASPASVAIDAVDVSREAIGRARTAVYRGGSFRGGMDDWSRFFHEAPAGRAVSGEVRALVRFAQANLLDPDFRPPHVAYDVIFCRNLLIYFDVQAQERVLGLLTALLVADGLLVVGAADTFAVRRAGFHPVPGAERAFLFQHRPDGPVAAAEPRRRTRPTLPRPVPKRQVKSDSVTNAAVPKTASPSRPVAMPVPDSLVAAIAELADAGRLADAVRLGEGALTTPDASAELLAIMGTTYAASNDDHRAEACYRRALYLDPSHADAMLHLALLLGQRGDAAGADRLRARARRLLTSDRPGSP